MCMCELGEHEIGLKGHKHMGCERQNDLMELIVNMVNEDLDDGALEPAVRVELLSGQYPSYAALRRRDSELAVEQIFFHRKLDMRPGNRPDRTMMTLNCTWMDEPIKITNFHCPSTRKRVWDQNVKDANCPMCSGLLASCLSTSGATAFAQSPSL